MSEQEPIDPALQAHIDRVLRVQPPSGPAVSLGAAFFRKWFKPTFVGLERLPSGPALFVGNHSLLAIDAFCFASLMNYDYGRFLRGLGDKSLFANQQYADWVIPMGGVLGKPEVVIAMMEAKKDLLLYPGGTYEAVKPEENRYELLWRERYGFIRLAAQMGYTIMPVAAVGPDEYYNQFVSGEALFESQLTEFLKEIGMVPENLRSDIVPPVPAGMFGTLMPKPKPTFYGFGRPVDLAEYKGKNLTRRQQERLRARVADEIDIEIKNLLLLRERRRHKDGLLRRLLAI